MTDAGSSPGFSDAEVKRYLLLVVSLESFSKIEKLGRADGKGFDFRCRQNTQVTHSPNVLCPDELPQASGAERKGMVYSARICILSAWRGKGGRGNPT